MTETVAPPRWFLLLVPSLLALAACGDDAASGGDGSCSGCGDGTSSQEVADACQPVSAKLAALAADCGDYPESGFQQPCANEGADAEEAGCLDEFRAEQACLAAQLSEESCTCGDSGFVCPDAPCTTEEDARRACVDG